MRVTAQQGDTADLLCFRHLGRTGGVTERVLEANPGLAALGPVLPVGTVVELPDPADAAPRTNDLIQLWD
jgi:phage tail protein X